MINVVLIDDEPRARQSLRLILEKYFFDQVTVIGEASGVNEAYELINTEIPDVVFLDIKMPDGSGFDLLKKFDSIGFKVVFVTAYEEHALEAIKFSALDYILKPINTNELRAAVDKLSKSIKKDDDLDVKLKAFFANLEESGKTKKKIVLKTAENIYLVPIQNIVRCEADCNYTWVYFDNQPRILISKSLKSFENMLKGFGFVRVHQSHLININHVVRVSKIDGGVLVFADNVNVPIAVRKRKELFEMLKNI